MRDFFSFLELLNKFVFMMGITVGLVVGVAWGWNVLFHWTIYPTVSIFESLMIVGLTYLMFYTDGRRDL